MNFAMRLRPAPLQNSIGQRLKVTYHTDQDKDKVYYICGGGGYFEGNKMIVIIEK